MAPGSIIIDVSIDRRLLRNQRNDQPQRSCSANTTWYYCVPTSPRAFPRTATNALSNIFNAHPPGKSASTYGINEVLFTNGSRTFTSTAFPTNSMIAKKFNMR
jgi:alanine dehydrogenase